jgi:hypothetical protein
MIRTEKLLTSRCTDKISEADRRGWPPSQITIENVYEDRSHFPVNKVLSAARSIRDFWWPAFLIVASLDVVYEFSKEKQEELGNFGKSSGGLEFLEKAARQNLSEFVVVKKSTALVDVVEVQDRDFAKAVTDLCDLQDKEILQVITDPEEEKGLRQALEWAESLEGAIQEQLDAGKSWETALSSLRVNDRSLFRRVDVC